MKISGKFGTRSDKGRREIEMGHRAERQGRKQDSSNIFFTCRGRIIK